MICSTINLTIAEEKTVWATQIIIFLGMLLNSRTQTISIPEDKRRKAIRLLTDMLDAKKKTTVLKIQQLAGLLNFLSYSIIYGKIFNRRYYAKVSSKNKKIKPHHRINVDREMRLDCITWLTFLDQGNAILCPFIDFKQNTVSADNLSFYSDASRVHHLGFGAYSMTGGYFPCGKRTILRSANQASNTQSYMH